jgi:hypothetical protein
MRRTPFFLIDPDPDFREPGRAEGLFLTQAFALVDGFGPEIRAPIAFIGVMPGLDPGIHSVTPQGGKRQWNGLPGQARQ